MLFRALTSVKLFLIVVIFMLISFFACILMLKGNVIHQVGLISSLKLLSTNLNILIVLSVFFVALLGFQTLICRLISRSDLLSILMHTFAGISLILMASFSTLKTYNFKIYPGTYVKAGETIIALENFKFNREDMNFVACFRIIKGKTDISSCISYNHPIISRYGNLWITDLRPSYSGIEIHAKYQPFSPLPLLLFSSSTVFLFLLFIKVAIASRSRSPKT